MTGEVCELERRFLELPHRDLRIRSRSRERALMASIEERGQVTPILVVPADRAGFFIVVDGHRRLEALARLRRDTVRAHILSLSPSAALLQIRVAPLVSRPGALEEGLLIAELIGVQGQDVEVVATRFGRSVRWVLGRLNLVQVLPDSVKRRVRGGWIPTAVVTQVLVPLARADAGHATVVASALTQMKVRLSDARRFLNRYRSLNPKEREALVADAVPFFKALRAHAVAGQGGTDESALAENGLLSDLARITRQTGQLAQRLRHQTLDGIPSALAEQLAASHSSFQQVVHKLAAAIAAVPILSTGGLDDRQRPEARGVPAESQVLRHPTDCARSLDFAIHSDPDSLRRDPRPGADTSSVGTGLLPGDDSAALYPVRPQSGEGVRGAGIGDRHDRAVLHVDALLPGQRFRGEPREGAGG